ncbi:MAG: c-type cytochrome [Candidatus Omnitrophica bacterium]|nr:c-type cytochrome [Candidatus Omnitrophota bacterium]
MRGWTILVWTSIFFLTVGVDRSCSAQSFDVDDFSPSALPAVPEGFEATFFALEPEVHNPAAIAFDAKGRLFVGHGPQFRHPKEDTRGDEVIILEDTDGDGVADSRKTFAHGFNSVQSLAWKGDDLWVANAPDLTVVRDLDGDDVADEYQLIFSGVGTLEHSLHGLNWAPDGNLYLSKGDTPVLPEAPKAFRELAHVPSDYPDTQPTRVFNAPDSEEKPYRGTYIVPTDPHTEGGILRCDESGGNLEIFARGMRNPYDICFDEGFNWFGTDNDQDGGDRIMMPFYGARYAHRHPWDYQWKGDDHLPTLPASGPFFHGSGTGVSYYSSEEFPQDYRGVFFIGDWLLQKVYVIHPRWDGALLKSNSDELEVFAESGPDRSLFRPTDVAVGPDGALYVSSWGATYGAEYDDSNRQINAGRIFRIASSDSNHASGDKVESPKRSKPLSEWTFDELAEDLDGEVLVWRVNAQDELVRRGEEVQEPIETALTSKDLTKGQKTWLAWALGRISPKDSEIDRFFLDLLKDRSADESLPIQSVRILAFRSGSDENDRLPEEIVGYLNDDSARLRFESVQAIWQTNSKEWTNPLIERLAVEEDRIVYFSLWGVLRDFLPVEERKELLVTSSSGEVRLGILLGLLEEGNLKGNEVVEILDSETDPQIQKWASKWMANVGQGLEDPKQVIDKILDLNKRGINYELRMNLLAALDRMEVHGEDWTKLDEKFYEGHKNGEIYVPEKSQEIALCLKILSRDERALPLLWDGLDHEWDPVRGAAIESFRNLDEKGREYLLARLDSIEGDQLEAAIEALSLFDLKKSPWTPNDKQVAAIVQACNNSTHPIFRQEALRLLTLVDSQTWVNPSAKSFAVELAKQTVLDPDPRIYTLAEELGQLVGEEVHAVRRDPATSEVVLSLLGNADASQGKMLFYQQGGRAACFQCHRVGVEGKNFAPDLSDAGGRLDPKTLVQSILEPNAVITEGYRAQMVETLDGDLLTGVIVKETDSSLEVVQSDGEAIRVNKADIVEKRNLDTSIMPSNFATLLTPEEVADIVAWLMSQTGPTDDRFVKKAE